MNWHTYGMLALQLATLPATPQCQLPQAAFAVTTDPGRHVLLDV